ncbi:MFS transporter [Cytobacillus sp. IB215316]|uniref:MDR family MFS transporter n=1 Tax=Cytobacillus sp. IB215316 TaxID=3097354 RepID=UPI002A142CA0|nr:MFS transporter [Cytobacillus sp. IB215316]MDX8360530.1 MFS transporter [Cytobacillus sp. IB215316]
MKWKDWDRNLKVRLFGEGVINILFWMYFPFMAIYFADHFGKGTAGLLLILSQCAGVIANLFGGYCADRFGRKKMMVYSYIGTAFSFILFAAANSPWYESPVLSFIAFSLLGIWGSLYWPASHAMVADVVPEKDRNNVFAIFYMMINIAVVVGPILGGIFFFKYRFELLVMAFVTSVIFSIVLQIYVRETAPKFEQTKQVDGDKKWYSFVMEQMRNYRVIVTDKVFFIFIIAGILVAQTFMQMDLMLAVYMAEIVPVQTILSFNEWTLKASGEQAFSWVIAENGLLVALFTVLATKVSNKFNERNVFMMSALTYGVAIILFGSTVNIWGLFFAMFIFTAAELMAVGIQEGYVAKLAPENMRGQYYAAASLRFTIGRTIAPISIPLTIWIGFTNTFYVIGLLAFVSAGLYYVMGYLMEQQTKSSKGMNKKLV